VHYKCERLDIKSIEEMENNLIVSTSAVAVKH
jgi:hypothetical protein